MTDWRVIEGDCLTTLATLEPCSVQTCVTSPPYFGLRDYGHDGQIGLEQTPDEYVARLVGVFRAVRRVLRDDGTVWLNLGDSYNAYNGNSGPGSTLDGPGKPRNTQRPQRLTGHGLQFKGLKPKDLLGVPWRVAFALQADGWYLRSDIIWSKPNPMPESVTDRPTKSHEYVFLLSKRARYFYDADAIREPHESDFARSAGPERDDDGRVIAYAGNVPRIQRTKERTGHEAGRNRRSVWTVSTAPYPGAHFATFPPRLIEPCILAGSPPKCCGVCGAPRERVIERIDKGRNPDAGEKAVAATGGAISGGTAMSTLGGFNGDTRTLGWRSTCEHDDDTGRPVVLDPFAGSGTTGMVALRHDRSFLGCELNPEYVRLARDRIIGDAPLLNTTSEAAA